MSSKVFDTSLVFPIPESPNIQYTIGGLFIANPEGFYFDSVDEIIANKGVISPLKHKNIPQAVQNQHLDLLNEFIDSGKYK